MATLVRNTALGMNKNSEYLYNWIYQEEAKIIRIKFVDPGNLNFV